MFFISNSHFEIVLLYQCSGLSVPIIIFNFVTVCLRLISLVKYSSHSMLYLLLMCSRESPGRCAHSLGTASRVLCL